MGGDESLLNVQPMTHDRAAWGCMQNDGMFGQHRQGPPPWPGPLRPGMGALPAPGCPGVKGAWDFPVLFWKPKATDRSRPPWQGEALCSPRTLPHRPEARHKMSSHTHPPQIGLPGSNDSPVQLNRGCSRVTRAPGIVSGPCFSLPAPRKPGEAAGGRAESLRPPTHALHPESSAQGHVHPAHRGWAASRAEQIQAAPGAPGGEGWPPPQATGPWASEPSPLLSWPAPHPLHSCG